MKRHRRNGRTEKALKGSNLHRKIAIALLAAGTLAIPGMASATDITAPLGKITGTKVETKGNVTTVTTTNVVGDNSINQFNKFNLSQGDIANLVMGKNSDGVSTSNQFNLVQDKINIDGVVNAIKDGKIGGNAYFLSSNGIVVGSTGVINAGSVHMYVPSDVEMLKLRAKLTLNNMSDTGIGGKGALQKYIDGTTVTDGALTGSDVSLNVEGKIAMNGKINAPDGISMHAADIEIGSTDARAALTTGALDFTDLVNVTDADGRVLVDSTLDTGNDNLKLEMKGSGDIVLEAKTGATPYRLVQIVKEAAETVDDTTQTISDVTGYVNDVGSAITALNDRIGEMNENGGTSVLNETLNGIGINLGLPEGLAVPEIPQAAIDAVSALAQNVPDTGLTIPQLAPTNLAESVNAAEALLTTVVPQNFESGIHVNNADLTSGGSIMGRATAENGNGAQLSHVNATVDVKGSKLTAGKAISLTAEANSTYEDKESSLHNMAMKGLVAASPLKVDISYADMNSSAVVTVDKDSILKTADKEEGNITLSADSNTKASLTTALAGYSFKDPAGGYIPPAALSYLGGKSKAEVSVEGKVEAAHDLKADALSSMDLSSTTSTGVTKMAGDASKGSLSVAITKADNEAAVNLKKGSSLEVGHDAAINANTKSDVQSSVSSSAGDAAAFVTAVNVMDYDSHAYVNVNGSVHGTGDISMNASNDVDHIIAATTDSIGKPKAKTALMETLTNNLQVGTITKNVKDLAGLAKDKFKNKNGSSGGTDSGSTGSTGEKETSSFNIGDYLKAGAAISYADADNTASVTIGDVPVKSVSGDVTIHAASTVHDVNFQASGASSSYKGMIDENNKNNTVAVANAAVLYGGLTNKADVDVKESTDKDHVISGRNVTITAASKKEYNRVRSMVDEVKENIEKTKDDWKKTSDYITNFKDNLEGENKADWEDLVEKTKALVETGKHVLAQINDITGTEIAPESMTSDDTWGNLYESDPTKAQKYVGLLSESLVILQNINDLQDALTQLTTSDTLTETQKQVADSVQSAVDILSGVTKFASPGNYLEYSASTKASSKPGIEVTGAGNVLITDINNTSHVTIGKGRVISAADELKVGTENSLTSTGAAGINKSVFGNAGGDMSIGGTVMVQDLDNEAVTAVAEGASLTAGKMSLSAKNDLGSYAVGVAAGKGGAAIDGTVSVLSGTSNAVVAVDDGASLTGKKEKDNASRDGNISLSSENDSKAVNVAGGLGLGSNAGIGASVAVNVLNVKTLSAINDTKDTLTNIWDDDKIKAAGLYTSTEGTAGAVNAYGLDVTADTTGLVASVSVAGGIAKTEGETKELTEEEKKKKDSGFLSKLNTLSSIPTMGQAMLADKLTGKDSLIGKAVDIFTTATTVNADGSTTTEPSKVSNAMNRGASEKQGGGKVNVDSSSKPSVSLAGAGSVSLNVLNNRTESLVKGTAVNLNDGDSHVKARNTAMDVAASGAAAVSWQGAGNKSTSVGIDGAVGLNAIHNTTRAAMESTKVTNAGKVAVEALSGGMETAMGLGLNVTKANSGSKSYQAGGAASVNILSNTVEAEIKDSEITGKGEGSSVDATALEEDVQITGGVQISGGNSSGTFGGALSAADISNTVKGSISGTTIKSVDSVKAQGLDSMTQVTAALGMGIATGNNSHAFNGSVVYNGLHNDVAGSISNGTIETNEGGIVEAVSGDFGAASENYKDYTDQLSKGLETNKEKAAKLSADTDGSSYYKGLDTKNAKDDRNKDDTGLTLSKGNHSGSTIVTAAVSAAGSKNASAGAAIMVTDIDNNFHSDITGSNITTHNVQALSDSDTFLVGTAGGVAAAKEFGGMGTVSWQDINNDTTATVEGSTLTLKDLGTEKGILKVEGTTDSLAANVAGQTTVSTNGSSLGAVLAYNDLDNNTGACLKGSTVNGGDITVHGKNDGDVYSLGAQVAVASEAAVNGTVAINTGKNNTEAIVSDKDGKRSALTGIHSAEVKAEDNTKLMSAVIGIGASGNAAAGAGIALTSIGGVLGNEANAQETLAQIRNTDISMGAKGDAVKVSALDDSTNITASVGIAAGSNAAVQGAAASGLVNKVVKASADGVTGADGNMDLSLSADNDSDIYTTAVVAAGSGNTAIGAGLGLNRIHQNTESSIHGGTLTLSNLSISSKADPSITALGLGGAGSGTAAVAGSFGVNMIDNDVNAKIAGASVTSTGNAGVVARSDEIIRNYAGVVSGSGSAAIGLSAAVNSITGSTDAVIENSTVTAEGSSDKDVVTESGMAVNGIIDGSITNKSDMKTAAESLIGTALMNNRKEKKDKGLVVDSSATHAVTSIMATAGGSGAGAAMGTVNVNTISGDTTASIRNSAINSADKKGNVAVRASDYTNSVGFTGAVAGGMYAAVGAVSDTNLVNRTTEASISGGEKGKKTLYARDLGVQADSRQGLFNMDISASATVEGVGAGGTVSVDKLQSITRAKVKNMDIHAAAMDVHSRHEDHTVMANTAVSGAAIGAGVGLTAGVVHEDSGVEAEVADSTVTAAGDVKVKGENASELTTVITSAGLAGLGAGLAGTTAVNNMTETVSAAVKNSTVTAKNISVTAASDVKVLATGGMLSGGAGGVGVSVSVNTFDDTVNADVSGSTLKGSNGVSVSAGNSRDVKQAVTTLAAGGVAAAGNIMVTTVNGSVDDADAKAGIDEANAQSTDNTGNIMGLEDSDGVNSHTTSVSASYGGGKTGSGVHTTISGSTITAGKTADVQAREESDVSMAGGSGVAGGASLNGSAGILSVKHDTKVLITGSHVIADAVNVLASQGDRKNGTSLNLYQGTAGTFSLGAAYGRVSTSGKTAVELTNSGVTGNSYVNVNAVDGSKAEINAYGLSGGAIAAGIIAAVSENDSTADVSIHTTKADGNNDFIIDGGASSFNAVKQNEVTTNAVGGAVGLASGVGINAKASDKGSASIHINDGQGDKGDYFTLRTTAGSFNAVNAPKAKVIGGSGAAGMYAAQVTRTKASVNGSSAITVGDNNTFKADALQFAARIGENGSTTANAKTVGVALSGAAGGSVNKAEAETATSVNVAVGNEIYEAGTTGASDTALTVSGLNHVSRKADVSALTVGGLIASGNSVAETKGTDSVTVSAKGGDVESLTLSSAGNSVADAHANGDGGGLADISSEAAKAVNTISSHASGTLLGIWTAKDFISARAYQNDTADMKAEATHVGALAVTGVKASTTIGGDATTMTIADGASINAGGKVIVGAKNTITTGQKYDYSVNGKVYGAAAANADHAESTVNKTAAVNIGKASITSAGSQTYEAATEGILKNNLSAEAAGAINGAVADTKNTTSVKDTIHVDKGAVLTNRGSYEKGGITMAAHDNLDLTATADTTIPAGLGGYLSARSDNTTTRDSSVNVEGKVVSSRDINLYAGKNAESGRQQLKMNLAAATYNHTALPVKTSPAVVSGLTESSRVIVTGDASGEAAGHVNVTAVSGRESIMKGSSLYSWLKGGKSEDREYVGNAEGVSDFGQKADNYVEVNGTLKAGARNRIDITIKGDVVPEDSYLAGTTTSGSFEISAKNGGAEDAGLKNSITSGTMSYANALYNRWNTLNNLIDAYRGNKDTDKKDSSWIAYNGYLAERALLEDEMEKLGLMEGTGEDRAPVTEGLNTPFVEIGKLIASGGNISVESDNLKGSGILSAKGSPSVSITNNSTAYLKVDGIEIGDAGGELLYNGKSIASSKNGGINEANKNKAYQASFGSVETSSPENGGTVSIINNYDKKSVKVTANPNKLTDDQKKDVDLKETRDFTPWSTVEITGSITNPLGRVTIDNKSGDIVVDSSETEEIGISGKEVAMNAKGSIIQGFTEGIINVGGSPEYVYKDFAEAMKAEAKDSQKGHEKENWTVKTNKSNADIAAFWKSKEEEITKSMDDGAGTYTTYYNYAHSTEDNGFIGAIRKIVYGAPLSAMEGSLDSCLSGPYKLYYAKAINEKAADWSATVGGKAILARAQAIISAANAETDVSAGGSRISGGSVYMAANYINVNGTIQSGYGSYTADIPADALDDLTKLSKVTLGGKEVYKVNDGGKSVLQSDGSYKYVVQVYYDPVNDRLFAEDVDTAGGKVILTGNISSTGNGKIFAADGAAEIGITNHTDKVLQTGKLINNDIDGQIIITDTATDTRTTYTRGNKETITNYSRYVSDHTKGTVTNDKKNTSAYSPQSGLRYYWTEGEESTTKETYQNDVRKGLWGAKETRNETEIKNYEDSHTPLTNVTLNGTPLPDGAFIAAGLADSKSDFNQIANNVMTDYTRSDMEHWMTKSGFLGWFHTHHYRWTVTTGSTQTYINSMKADNAIGIGFLGQDKGTVTLKSTGTLNLDSSVTNRLTGSTLSITSDKGAINFLNDAAITADAVTLSGAKGINNVRIVTTGNTDGAGKAGVDLSAVAKEGNINIEVTGGYFGNNVLPGNVAVRKLEAGGSVSLTADGNITQVKNGSTPKAAQGSSLRRANANNSYEAIKGSRIDLVSTNGSISNADGSAVIVRGGQNASSADPLSASVNASARGDIRLTQDSGNMRVGIISSKEGDVVLTAKDGTFIDALPSETVNNNIDTDTLVHRWIDAGLIAGDDSYEGAYVKKLREDRDNYKESVEKAFKEYQNLKSFYEKNTEAEVTEVYSELDTRFKDFTDAASYLAQDTEYQAKVKEADSPTYEWTKDQLLYAIKDAIINKNSGSTDMERKVANVSGRNVTLEAKGIGVNSDSTTVIPVDNLTTDNLKLLANTVASDVTTTREGDHGPITSFVIQGKVPLGIYTTGMVNINASDNIYLAGRGNDSDVYAPVNLGHVVTENKDVRILGKAGVFNSLTDGSANIKANDLLIEGGSSNDGGRSTDIGTSEMAVTVDLSDTIDNGRIDYAGLSAHTDGSIYLKSVGTGTADKDLKISDMYAGKSASLEANGNIVMDPEADEAAYINVGDLLNLKTDGAIGSKDRALRILADGAAVNSSGSTGDKTGDVYLKGVKGVSLTDDTVELALGNINSNGVVRAESAGTLLIGREEDRENKKSEAAGSVQAGSDSSLKADTIVLNGTVNVKESKGNLNLTAVKGSITETAKGIIKAAALATESSGKVILDNEANTFTSYTAKSTDGKAIHGSVGIRTHGGSNFHVNLATVEGDVSIENLSEKGGITVDSDITASRGAEEEKGSVTLKGKGDLDLGSGKNVKADDFINFETTGGNVHAGGNADAGGYIHMSTDNGNVEIDGNETAGTWVEGRTENGGVIVKGNITSNGGSTTLYAGDKVPVDEEVGNISVNGNITSAKAVDLDTEDGNIAVSGTVEAKGGDITADARNSGNISFAKEVKASGSVHGRTDKGNVLFDNSVTATAGHIEAASDSGNATIKGTSTAGTYVDAETKSGDVLLDGHVKAEKEYVKVSSGNGKVTIRGTTEAGTYVDVETAKGDVLFDGTVNAHGSYVKAYSGNGSVTVKGNTTGHSGVTAETVTGNILLDGAVTAENGNVKAAVTGTGSEGHGNITVNGATTAAEDVDMTTMKGNVILHGDVTATAGHVKAASGSGNITVEGLDGNTAHVNAGDYVHASTDRGDVLLNGNVKSNSSYVKGSSGNGRITVKGTTEAGSHVEAGTARGDVLLDGDVTAHGDYVKASSGNGSITVKGNTMAAAYVDAETMSGDVLLNGHVKAEKDYVKASSGNGNVTINGTTESGSYVDAESTEGNVLLDGTVTAQGDYVKASSGNGSVTVKGNTTAGTYVEAETGIGDVLLHGAVTAEKGLIHALSKAGHVTLDGTASAGTTINAEAHEGSVLVNGSLTSKGGDTTLTALDNSGDGNRGNITVIGSLTSSDNAVMNSTNGDVSVHGTVNAASNVNTTITGKGNATFGGTVTGESGNVKTHILGDGHILYAGAVHAGTDVDTRVDGNGAMEFTGSTTAGRDITGEIIGTGDITAGTLPKAENTVFSAGRNISLKTAHGSINNHSIVHAADNINLAVNDGNLWLDGDMTADTGSLNALLTGKGHMEDRDFRSTLTAGHDINMTHKGLGRMDFTNVNAGHTVNLIHEGTGDIHAEQGKALNGDVNVIHRGVGNADLGTLTAEEGIVHVELAHGDLFLNKATGQGLALLVKDPTRSMTVGELEASNSISLNGSSMSLGTVSQRDDGRDMLVLDMKGTSSEWPITGLTISSLRTKKGALLPQLWAVDADIHADSGDVHVDKLYALGKVDISTNDTNAAVYGKAPLREGNGATYWNNTSLFAPETMLDLFYTSGRRDGWMYLDMSNPGTVHVGNGPLIDMMDYHYPYSQRFSAVNLMQKRLSMEPRQWLEHSPIALYDRYNLVTRHFEEKNATAEEIEMK